MLVSGPVELRHSLGGVLHDLHEDRLVGDKLVAQGHHVRQVISCPGLDIIALKVLQFYVVWLLITHLP